LKEVDELVIIVGSSQHSHSFKNPFTCGERISMIRMAMNENNIAHSKYLVVPVPDVENHALWVSLIVSMIPRFEKVYSNDPLTTRLFKEAKIEVKNIPLYEREKYSATEVRRRMLEEENWRELLPTSVANFITEIDGVSRIQRLNAQDNN
jgi:nicotinamide-nucleotide adenylyltransferase